MALDYFDKKKDEQELRDKKKKDRAAAAAASRAAVIAGRIKDVAGTGMTGKLGATSPAFAASSRDPISKKKVSTGAGGVNQKSAESPAARVQARTGPAKKRTKNRQTILGSQGDNSGVFKTILGA